MNVKTLGGVAVLLATLLWAGSLQGQTNWWTGGGDGSSWNDANNWSDSTVPTTNHTVQLGYADGGTVADAPQSITLATETSAVALVVMAEGNRQVTLSGSALTLNSRNNAIQIDAGADSATTFNVDIGIVRRANLLNNSTQDLIIAGSTFRPAFDALSGTYEVRYYGSTNTLRLQGTNFFPIVHRQGGAVLCETDGQVIGRWQPEAATCSLHLAASPIIGAITPSFPHAPIYRVGAADRVAQVQNLSGTAAASVRLMPGDPGQGHLTLRVGWFVGAYVETSSNSTVEVYPHSVTTRRLMEWTNNVGVTGPGGFRVIMPAATFGVGRPMDYSGGTLISTGTLQLVSAGVGKDGGLPETGLVIVETNGIFDLNGINDTIGSLGGVGNVLLGGATLTVAEGVAPGLSVGTQTISESGAVVLGGTNTFEIEATNVYDRVIIPTADLTLGGTLNVVVNGPFKDEYYTSYKLFDLTAGTASGMFVDVEHNFSGIITCTIDANNDVIMTISRTTGTLIMLR